MDIIKITGLSHRYPDGRTSLEGIDLSIAGGSFVVLAGANGAGKSTLLKHLNGLLRPQQGTVEIAGVPVQQDLRHARRIVGMVFQDADSQIVGETVYDDAAFGPENLNWPAARIRESVDAALELVGLGMLRDRSPHLLSGGEKRRLAIAGVLAMAPEVIVLDEPFANLDYDGVRQVLAHIVALHGDGRTIIVCVHDLEKVLAHAQRLIILQRGRIAADGPPEQAVLAAEACGVRLPAAIRMGGVVESWLR
ncbi:MAG TPA: ABC transporter ATP-binding protein [Desulfoprunum sp.]|nr:ABC transporter ATP-binding protein [Desulfoprunum sp.]